MAGQNPAEKNQGRGPVFHAGDLEKTENPQERDSRLGSHELPSFLPSRALSRSPVWDSPPGLRALTGPLDLVP